MDGRGFGTKQDFIPLFSFMYVYILWQGQKVVLAILEFEFVNIFYSKFQVVSTFYLCSKFCVEIDFFAATEAVNVGVDVRGFGNKLFIYT